MAGLSEKMYESPARLHENGISNERETSGSSTTPRLVLKLRWYFLAYQAGLDGGLVEF
jgi:hypothetical protein